jgi:hypothetical protein
MEVVVDAGPIPYREIALYADGDLEHGLEHYGVQPEKTSYRLLEIPVREIADTASMPHRVRDRVMDDVVRAGTDLPPLVVFRHRNGRGWGLLDGVGRTNADVVVGIDTARVYELIEDGADNAKRSFLDEVVSTGS